MARSREVKPGEEYAKAGVNYKLIQPFKELMKETGRQTHSFPNKRGVFVLDDNETFQYQGNLPNAWRTVQEGLGNKDWAAEWMRQYCNEDEHQKNFFGVAIDLAMMAANDVLSRGALPVIYHNEVAPRASEWFQNDIRNKAYALGTYHACYLCGMALLGGESPAYKYLVRAEPPVVDAPVMSCTVVGIIAPDSRRITGEKLRDGDVIIGVGSSGLHSNGVSLVLERGLELPDKLKTVLDDGRTLGEHMLIPTRCYVELMERLLKEHVDIHAFQPITGDGVAKIAFDKRPFTYRVRNWPEEIPLIFRFMERLGVSPEGILKTFNCGIGAVIFVPPHEANSVLYYGKEVGYKMFNLGVVEKGQRQVIFEPRNITLPPPGE
jgi:phosphoribosylformylglycinamidine cyclo-ligase